VYKQQQQEEQQEEQQNAENPFLDPPFSRLKSLKILFGKIITENGQKSRNHEE
jgi:hypothetical protein